MDDQQRLKTFLEKQKYMLLGVVLGDGSPWVVPVRITVHSGNTFEWYSKLDTLHSRSIANKPDIAITIYMSKNDDELEFGFYAKAMATLLGEDNGVGHYRAIVTRAWVNDYTYTKREIEI